jgi:hypothetical protein
MIRIVIGLICAVGSKCVRTVACAVVLLIFGVFGIGIGGKLVFLEVLLGLISKLIEV